MSHRKNIKRYFFQIKRTVINSMNIIFFSSLYLGIIIYTAVGAKVGELLPILYFLCSYVSISCFYISIFSKVGILPILYFSYVWAKQDYLNHQLCLSFRKFWSLFSHWIVHFVLKFSQYFLSPCTNTAIGAGGIQNNRVINCKHKSMIENQEKYKSPIIVGGKCLWSDSSQIPIMGLREFL